MSRHTYGVALVLFAALIWGLGGICGQFLFNSRGVTSWWLISIRMLFGGVVFLGYDLLINRTDIFEILKKRTKDLLIFAFTGLLFAQLFFYWCVELCNAATATVIQYSAPVLIMIWTVYKSGRAPSLKEILGVVGAFTGIFLIATHGRLDSLAISPKALIVGIISAIGYAVYSVKPVDLLKEYKTITVVGWGHILPGLVLCAGIQPWNNIPGTWDLKAYLALSILLIFATVVTFACFLHGLSIIGPLKASLLSCAEPLSAIVFVVTILDTKLVFMDYVGMLFIIGTVLMLSLSKE